MKAAVLILKILLSCLLCVQLLASGGISGGGGSGGLVAYRRNLAKDDAILVLQAVTPEVAQAA